MPATQYYIQENILSINQQDGPVRECVYVPAGAVVSVLSEPDENNASGNQLIEVEWERKRVLMFNVDILERAQPL